MPISDSELARPVHGHVRCPHTHSVHAALHAWRSTPGSVAWWWLIIEHKNQLYTAIRFSELYNLLKPLDAPVHMNTPLADLPYWHRNPHNPTRGLPGVVSPAVVERDGISIAQVRELIEENPENVVVVLRNGVFQGIVSSDEHPVVYADEPLRELLAQFEAGGDDQTIILPRKSRQDSG